MAFRRVMASCAKSFPVKVNGNVMKALHTGRALMEGNNGKTKGPCDPGVCPREQMNMKQFLDRKEAEYLQPARSKFQIATFTISRPHVEPYIVPELEQNCLQKKRCEDLKRGKTSEGAKQSEGEGAKHSEGEGNSK